MSKPRRRALALPLVVAAALGASTAAPSVAFGAAQLTSSPAILHTKGSAGETLHRVINLTGAPDQTIVVDFQHADYGFDGRTYAPVIIRDDAKETTSFSTRGWFGVPHSPIKIPAGATVGVDVDIAIPGNTPSGTYLGLALFRVRPSTSPGVVVQAVPETGAVVFVDVSGGDPPRAKVDSFELPWITTSDTLHPQVVLANSGETVFSTSGTIRVPGAGKAARAVFEPQVVMPGLPRELRTRSQGSTMRLRTSGFFPALRTVELRARIDPTNATLVERHRVLVVRPHFLLTLLGLLGCAAAYGLVRARERRLRQRRTGGGAAGTRSS